ncbi:hypothetical protein B0T16DRAFT_453140 [Cercophora newfieldiana]|uniref:Rrn9 domain-containing protein n=1 Tax=Cercophora newfieldiana TaxID=92897 RepID=A0AA39YS90_9PEZI|nr:hypothetical protein B0T16DRAFT_453140 [Cercophora newfieldiana]
MNSSEDEDDPSRPLNIHLGTPQSKSNPNPNKSRSNHGAAPNNSSSYDASSYDASDENGEWDESTDDINSLSSEELNRTRPNRWTGAVRTWTTYAEREGQSYAALVDEKRGNLSEQLYDVCALKERLAEWDSEEEEDEKGPVEQRLLESWTAWPIRAAQLPHLGLMRHAPNDEHEKFTVRRPDSGWPSENLENEISATVLRLAKEKFRRRKFREEQPDPDVMETIEHDEVDDSEGDSAERGDEGESGMQQHKEGKKREEESFKPVHSADDELSYSILRPATRRILSQLDQTLAILHNSRMAPALTMNESEPDDDTETEASQGECGLSRKQSLRKKNILPSSSTGQPKEAHDPEEGGDYEEVLSLGGRESKRRMPEYYGYDTQSDDGVQQRKRNRSDSVPRMESYENFINMLGLRDWRDVMAAAAMAGFSESVMARTVQRCSTLFGQEMIIHTLPEQGMEPCIPAMQTVKYTPGAPSTESSEEEDNTELAPVRARARRRIARKRWMVPSIRMDF